MFEIVEDENFSFAVNEVLKAEGGYINHPNDRGGATNFGITEDTLARYRGVPVSDDDVRNMRVEEAKSIYHKFYWCPLGLDQVEDKILAYLIFDQGVNRGIFAAAKQVQEVIGVKVDGKIGPVTIERLNSFADSKRVAIDFVKRSQISYAKIVQNNPSQSVFIVGWLNRSHKLLDMAIWGA